MHSNCFLNVLLSVMLAAGVKESSRFNNIFTCLNLGVVVFAIIAGSIKSDTHNWQLTQSEVTVNFCFTELICYLHF